MRPRDVPGCSNMADQLSSLNLLTNSNINPILNLMGIKRVDSPPVVNYGRISTRFQHSREDYFARRCGVNIKRMIRGTDAVIYSSMKVLVRASVISKGPRSAKPILDAKRQSDR